MWVAANGVAQRSGGSDIMSDEQVFGSDWFADGMLGRGEKAGSSREVGTAVGGQVGRSVARGRLALEDQPVRITCPRGIPPAGP